MSSLDTSSHYRSTDASSSLSSSAPTSSSTRPNDHAISRNDNDDNAYDDDDSGDAGSDDSSSDAPADAKVLPNRVTRGARVTSAAGEGDDEFWQQQFFADAAEEAEDGDYQRDDEDAADREDQVDSDFDEDEDDKGEGEEEKGERRKAGDGVKKSTSYVDPEVAASKRAAAAKKAAAAKSKKLAADAKRVKKLGPIDQLPNRAPLPVPMPLGSATTAANKYDDESGFPAGDMRADGSADAGGDIASSPSVRFASSPTSPHRSSTSHRVPLSPSVLLARTLAASSIRRSDRGATKLNSETTMKKGEDTAKALAGRKKAAKVSHRVLTQADQLEESAKTEMINEASLATLQRIEEERKKEAAPKPKPVGNRIRVRHFTYNVDEGHPSLLTLPLRAPHTVHAIAPVAAVDSAAVPSSSSSPSSASASMPAPNNRSGGAVELIFTNGVIPDYLSQNQIKRMDERNETDETKATSEQINK